MRLGIVCHLHFILTKNMQSIVLTYLLFLSAVNARSVCDEVPFVNRTSWGAREPTSITNLTGKPLSFYVIHHSYQPTR